MKGFDGFPDTFQMTGVPVPFFTELLPHIDDLGEMKVILYCFWALPRKETKHRYMTRQNFLQDDTFMSSLGRTPAAAEAALEDALERATARGVLLHAAVDTKSLYFVNTARGRASVEALARGDWQPGERHDIPAILEMERPNAFVLYEQNIGPLTPMIADLLREMEASYPQSWIEEAVQEAVVNNARSLAYVRAILKRWQAQGKDRGKHRGDTEKDRRQYFDGEYADFIET